MLVHFLLLFISDLLGRPLAVVALTAPVSLFFSPPSRWKCQLGASPPSSPWLQTFLRGRGRSSGLVRPSRQPSVYSSPVTRPHSQYVQGHWFLFFAFAPAAVHTFFNTSGSERRVIRTVSCCSVQVTLVQSSSHAGGDFKCVDCIITACQLLLECLKIWEKIPECLALLLHYPHTASRASRSQV